MKMKYCAVRRFIFNNSRNRLIAFDSYQRTKAPIDIGSRFLPLAG
jgi:hypothetical protein